MVDWASMVVMKLVKSGFDYNSKVGPTCFSEGLVWDVKVRSQDNWKDGIIF